MPPRKVSKKILLPIYALFKFLQTESHVQVMLYENTDMRLEGTLSGLDEFMNIVLSDAVEISLKHETRTPVGKVLLKGDNITSIFRIKAPGAGES
ncbi:MAG: hypothetical protein MHM6MM_002679 [Cercozoa sp. M6MM]